MVAKENQHGECPSTGNISGDWYSSHQATVLLRLSHSALAELAVQRKILAMPAAGGETIYPKDQFDGTKVVNGLAAVLGAIEHWPVDDWAVVSWLRDRRSDQLEGESLLSWLKADGDLAEAVALAQQYGGGWSR
jgi:hypothetical protein